MTTTVMEPAMNENVVSDNTKGYVASSRRVMIWICVILTIVSDAFVLLAVFGDKQHGMLESFLEHNSLEATRYCESVYKPWLLHPYSVLTSFVIVVPMCYPLV